MTILEKWHHWFKYWLGDLMYQAIIWIDFNQVLWWHTPSSLNSGSLANKPSINRVELNSYINVQVIHLYTCNLCFLLGLGHETVVSTVCRSIILWICYMTGLLRVTFMSWWYFPRICLDMQHYYHARYPTDDWHLAYVFIGIFFRRCVSGRCVSPFC